MYHLEVKFIDSHWLTLVGALSESGQLENSMGCLILLTECDHMLSSLELCDDERTNSRRLLNRLRKFLQTCSSGRERQRCINVILVSIEDAQAKLVLCDKWEACESDHQIVEKQRPTVQVITGRRIFTSMIHNKIVCPLSCGIKVL